MRIIFKTVKIYNFNSYHEALFDLKDKGFCLVSGENHYIKDNAASNGAGKSTFVNAICFALTGDTTKKVHTNLQNNMIEEDLSYVELDFDIDKDNYVITRYIAPKSDLKIIKNGTEVGGKGIRDSSAILEELLPDLNYNYLTSTIILGQGMPNKFSSLVPAAKKQRLEELTKSDFMIEDIKTRVNNRQLELDDQVRTYDDSLLVNNTQLNTVNINLNRAEEENKKLVKPDFDTDIKKLTKHLESVNKDIKETGDKIKEINKDLEKYNTQYLTESNKRNDENTKELAAYNTAYNEKTAEKARLNAEYNSLDREIKRLKAIKDVCPTCGQKLKGVEKPDTSKQEKELKEIGDKLFKINTEIDKCNNTHKGYQTHILESFNAKTKDITKNINELKRELNRQQDDLNDFTLYAEQDKEALLNLNNDKTNWDNKVKNLAKAITELQTEQARLTAQTKITTDARQVVLDRLSIVKKIETLIKRDFRGYLLVNIIAYLDKKLKEYSKIVFGTEDLAIKLSGNALNITYCNKNVENLSGGEEQRVDLILQLAIRSLMNEYFGYSSNIIVLDEITDNLDQVSCEAIMKLLTEVLKDVESVFIISHHTSELGLPCDSELKIVKDETGISSLI